MKGFSRALGTIVFMISLGQAQYLEPVSPTNPDVDAVPGDGFVKVYWNAKPESDIDSVLQKLYPDVPAKWNNFEGYKIYRATDYEFEEVHSITDGLGHKLYYKPLVVFDKFNKIEGYFKGNSGLGIPLVFTNSSENTFDNSLPPFYPDIQPMDMPAELFGESGNGSWRLHIADADTSKNSGQLVNWEIGFKAAGDTGYVRHKGTITDLNVVENSGFNRFADAAKTDPESWERYQPESMFFEHSPNEAATGDALKISIDNFWEVSTKNRIDNGDFEEPADTTGWDQLTDNAAVALGWVAEYASLSSGWLTMKINSNSNSGLCWNLATASQFEPNTWVAFTVRIASENRTPNGHLYLSLNNGQEKVVDLGLIPANTTELHYYRRLNSRLTSANLYVGNGQGTVLYVDQFRASTAEYMTQEVYQRLSRVVPGAHYEWKTKIYENDPGIVVAPGYRAYQPNQVVKEFRQYGVESTVNKNTYQYFSRSFDAPEDMQDGIFFYRVDVNADEWKGQGEFILDSLVMIGNSKWGLNLYPEVSTAIDVEGASQNWDDFRVTLDIAHPWLYELDITLEAPSGDSYSLMNGQFAKSFLDGSAGLAQYLGSNSGLQYTYVDTSVNNGQRYFYAVVAYDSGDSLFNILPSEGSKRITLESDRYVFDSNTVMAIPNPYSKGYQPAALNSAGIIHTGHATGSVSLDIVDDRKIVNDSEYEIYFYDSSTDPNYALTSTIDFFAKKTTAYGVRNVTTGDTLLAYVSSIDKPSPVFEGLRLQLTNADRINIIPDSIRWSGSDLAHPEILMNLSDLSGNRFPVRYRLTFYDEIVDTSQSYKSGFVTLNARPVKLKVFDMIGNKDVKVAYRAVTGKDDFILYPLFEDTLDKTTNPVNYPYKSSWYIKLIFDSANLISLQAADKGGLFYWQDPDSTILYERVSGSKNLPPLKAGDATIVYWDDNVLVPSQANPVNVTLKSDTLLNPGLFYFKGWMKSTSEQSLSFGIGGQNTTFTVGQSFTELKIPIEIDQAGNLQVVWHSTGDDTLWIYDISITEKYRYADGDFLDVATTIKFSSDDNYRFSTLAASQGLVTDDGWSNFSVVPNPYIVSASWDYSPDLPGNFPNKVAFINLTADAVLRIYTVRGDLVRKLQHTGDIFDGTLAWDLLNESGKKVAFGIYIYHITSSTLGEKTGKLAIIR